VSVSLALSRVIFDVCVVSIHEQLPAVPAIVNFAHEPGISKLNAAEQSDTELPAPIDGGVHGSISGRFRQSSGGQVSSQGVGQPVVTPTGLIVIEAGPVMQPLSESWSNVLLSVQLKSPVSW
jgi:hypothetical protein